MHASIDGTRSNHVRRVAPALIASAILITSRVAPAEELKLSRIAMFSSGVAYFQVSGAVEGNATSELRFRTPQINDIIKSLVLQDFDGGTIRAVQYPSRDPIEKTLRSFGVDITGKPTLGELLNQLRGVPVETAAPTAARGLILGVEKQKMAVDQRLIDIEVLTIVTDGGLRSFKLSELGGIRILDAKIDGELRKALETLATSHDADKKTVTLEFAGQGKRRVQVGYLLEAPIWKTSYRLVLSDDKKPYLQGWATIENTTEEDWKDVRLSLVSGRPISFIMDLYTPIYVPRPKEELELYASLRPPTYEGAMEQAGEAVNRQAGDSAKKARAARAFSFSVAAAPAAEEPTSHELDLKEDGVVSVATAQSTGELFTYDIPTPVSLARQQSALLPIVTGEIDGAKLSIYNPATHSKYPLNGVQITNTTGLNLMQGPVTVFDGNLYAGDAKLPDLRPDEKRLMSYALDLAVEVEQVMQSQPEEVVKLRIAKGTLWYQRKLVDGRTYNVKNKDRKARAVLIEQPYGPDWKLIEPSEPFERATNLYRFKLDVPPGTTGSLKVVLERYVDSTIVLASAGLDQIQWFLRHRTASPAVRKAMDEVIVRRTTLDQIIARRNETERQVSTIEQDQSRIRENLKSLPATSDIARRYLAKLDQQETQLEGLRKQVDDYRRQEQTAREELEKYLLGLEVE